MRTVDGGSGWDFWVATAMLILDRKGKWGGNNSRQVQGLLKGTRKEKGLWQKGGGSYEAWHLAYLAINKQPLLTLGNTGMVNWRSGLCPKAEVQMEGVFHPFFPSSDLTRTRGLQAWSTVAELSLLPLGLLGSTTVLDFNIGC